MRKIKFFIQRLMSRAYDLVKKYRKRLDTGLLWIETKGIHIFAAIAVTLLTTSVVIDSMKPSPEFVIEPDDRPIIYDLCLAYLGAYIFNILVVVLPARRRQVSLYRTLRGQLMTIAHNGRYLIYDLETVGGCPHIKEPTIEHLTKVMSAVNSNDSVLGSIAYRMDSAVEQFNELVPYLSNFPLDLQIALQKERHDECHGFFDYGIDPRYVSSSNSHQEMRSEVTPLLTQQGWKRLTMKGSSGMIWDYYLTTESLLVILEKYLPEYDDEVEGRRRGEGVRSMGAWEPEVTDYPPTAFHDDLPDSKLQE